MSRNISSTNARLALASVIFLALAAGGVATATLTTQGASALAGNASAVETATRVNVTVALKNREFPLKVRMTMQPCAISACIDV